MKLNKDKKIAASLIIIIFIPLIYFILLFNKNSYLKCQTNDNYVFFLEIDRPNSAKIYSKPTFIKGQDYSYYTKLHITKTDILIKDKDKFLGRQFRYDDLKLNRLDLNLYAIGQGLVGFCQKIEKSKRKL